MKHRQLTDFIPFKASQESQASQASQASQVSKASMANKAVSYSNGVREQSAVYKSMDPISRQSISPHCRLMGPFYTYVD